MSDEIQKSEVEAEIVDVSEFLSLKLLGRDAKVRVSDAFDATEWAGNSSLLAVSNKLGWFVAGTPAGLVASPLKHLRERQSIAPEDGPTPLEPKRTISIAGAPFFVGFAASDTKLVAAVQAADDWNLEIFNSQDVCKEGSDEVKPLHTFSLGREVVIDMQPNPSEDSEIVAILRGRTSSKSCLDIINVVSSSRVTSWGPGNALEESSTFTSLSWSVRGKQIVAGTRGGELAQFTPEGERKQTISPPPSLSTPQAVVSVLWLENTVFHVVYGNPASDPSDPTHEYEVYNIIFDPKAKTASYIKFTDPSPPYGVASRLSCRHYVRLAGWEPTKHLVFVADGPSTDVGIVGCLNPSEASGKPIPWGTLEVDETSRVSLPMDDEMNETSVMGLGLDLTSTDSINNSKEAGDDAAPSPPSPILYLYTSAGLVISYHILNSREGKYPGMSGATESAISPRPSTPPASTLTAKPTAFAGFGTGAGAFGATTTPKANTAFAQPSTTPAFGAPAFGSTTPAGAPAFGVSSFGASTTPAKPTITFGSSTTPAATPAFGQTSSFGSTGFGKFASTTPVGAPAAGGGFAGFGGKSSAFGSGATTPTSATEPGSAKSLFGGGSNFGSSSAFGSSGATTPKSAGGFSAFGSTTPAFGSTTPAFGSTTPAFAPRSPTATPKSEAKLRDNDQDPDSPEAAKPSVVDDDDIISPPRSPAAKSDDGLDVDSLDLGGGAAKKLPAGLDFSDDDDGPNPAETPSKPPTTASAFAGFGKPSAFGSAATGGAFGAAPSTGFGAFGSKPTSPSPGFGFGSASKPAGDASKPAFGGGSAFGSTSAFGTSSFGTTSAFGSTSAFGTTTAFGAAAKPAAATGGVAFGATSTPGATSAPKFGAPSAFGSAAPAPASTTSTTTEAPKSGGFAAFAAKPGDSKPVGFAGFGDAAKGKAAGGFAAFAKPEDTKAGGFAGFGNNTKATEQAEKSTEPEKAEAKAEETKEEVKKEAKEEPREATEEEVAKQEEPVKPETEKPSEDKPAQVVTVPPKSVFGLLVSSPPPKPKVPSPSPEPPKPSSEIQSKIPVPKATGFLGLPPKPGPEKPAPETEDKKDTSSAPTPPRSESTTPPGSPTSDPPPAASPKAATPSISPFGLGKPPARPFGSAFNSAPLKSSPLASPPVTREDPTKHEEFVKVDPPALIPKAPSPFGGLASTSLSGPASSPFAPASTAASTTPPKPASTGFFGFGKPAPAAEAKDKDAKPQAEQWPASFSGAMKGLGPASVTSGSPQVPPPSSSSPTPATVASAPATTSVATTATGSLFGMSTAKPPPTFSFGTPTVSTSASPFGTPGVKLAPPSFFGPTPTASTPPPAPIPAPAPAPSMFSGFKPQATTAAPSKASVPVFAAPAMPTGPTTPQAPLSHVEAEFNKLLEQMATEFDKLRQDTVALQERHAQKARAGISLPNLQSTSDPRKWGLGDLKALKQVTSLVAKEVNQLQGLNKDFISQVTELQPGAEKVHAKKNEIARYLKAKKDPKYTRLFKSRISSPEHVESQTKLRKSIQVVRERTRQLEDFMATQKARLQKQKEGRREFKVPSLDTINRTLRNIDVALAQKTDEIVALTARVDRMKLKAPKRKASTNGTVPLTLPAEETEKIKLASAAALNMERTSIRLKNALLQARPETPLNVSAVGAPVEPKPNALAKILPAPTPMPAPTPKPTTASTPAPAQTPSVSFAPKTPAFGARAQASLFAPKPPATPATPAMPGAFVPLKAAAPATPSFVLPVAPAALPAFSPLGKDEFHVTAGYEHSARRSEKSRMHGPSAKFKTPSPGASRTLSEVGESPVPVTPLSPLITPAKSFFGTSTPVAVQPVRNPVPFSFASPPPGGAGASAPSPGFNLFQTPAQKAAAATTTPKLPPIPDWGVTSFDSSIGSVRGSESNTTEEDEDGEGEGEEDDEEDDDWVPGDEDEDDEDEDDEDAASDDVEEGVEDDDPTV